MCICDHRACRARQRMQVNMVRRTRRTTPGEPLQAVAARASTLSVRRSLAICDHGGDEKSAQNHGAYGSPWPADADSRIPDEVHDGTCMGLHTRIFLALGSRAGHDVHPATALTVINAGRGDAHEDMHRAHPSVGGWPLLVCHGRRVLPGCTPDAHQNMWHVRGGMHPPRARWSGAVMSSGRYARRDPGSGTESYRKPKNARDASTAAARLRMCT